MKQSRTSKKESAVLAGSNQLTSRIITALIGVPLLIAFLFISKMLFLTVITLIIAFCIYEYLNLLRQSKNLNLLTVSPGIIYTTFLLSLLLIFNLRAGRTLVLFTFLGTWAFDTAAYYVGSAWGEHKLIPRISPKKSLEGLLAGIAAVSSVAIFLPSTQGLVIPPAVKILWISTLSTAAFSGDLIESAFKRWVGVKDSSRLLPGHGGFLDRFDSLILTSVASYLIFRWLL